jgi:hypothetical protein
MAETAFSAVEHALENQPVGGLQIRECGFDSRPDLHSFQWLGADQDFSHSLQHFHKLRVPRLHHRRP